MKRLQAILMARGKFKSEPAKDAAKRNAVDSMHHQLRTVESTAYGLVASIRSFPVLKRISAFIWDFPYGFVLTARVGFCRDCPPLPAGCKDLFPECSDYPLAQGCCDANFASRRSFSPGREDTSSAVSSYPKRLLSLFLHPDNAVANLSRPIPSRMAGRSNIL